MKKTLAAFAFAAAFGMTLAAGTASANSALLQQYASQAGGASFSAERGKAIYFGDWTGKQGPDGKTETPKCTSCHGATPQQGGETRAGKPIDPMAKSRTADRFNDPEKVEKWFRRNCTGVIGRECTPQEKGDFLTFLLGQ